jgi:hypothetical protein
VQVATVEVSEEPLRLADPPSAEPIMMN